MINRKGNVKPVPLNLVGSSVFGRYPKISIEKTLNMFQSDTFMVPYAGYQLGILSSIEFNSGTEGRGIFTSTKLGKLVLVIGNGVFLANINYSQQYNKIIDYQIAQIGILQTSSGPVYITENNKPQIAISDNSAIYIYDPNPTAPNTKVFQSVPINFTPGYITFHDTYFLCAASNDNGPDNSYVPPANNTWRLSAQNDGIKWDTMAANIGLLETKPDNTKAVVRFPSKGNMIWVMGENVTESWTDTGAQLFPYQRTNQYNIDYGCVSPASVAYMDEIVVWLASNEKSGPILMYSSGGMPEKITTDGIDYLFSQLTAPEDSQGFLYRQDGHLFYHINFYTDNFSLFVDFLPDGTHKIYNASDQNLDYFIAAEIAFFNNQYYFVSKNDGNLYIFDTVFTTYQNLDADGNLVISEIPRIRTCKNIRLPSQEYFIANDVGFTIETGETDYQQNSTGPINLITQDGRKLITQGGDILLITQNSDFLTTQDGKQLLIQQQDPNGYQYLISNQLGYDYITPCVDLSVSRDGGASFGNDFRYELNPIGQRRNKLMWWQIGLANDMVLQFKFWGMGRFVLTDGEISLRV